MPAHDLSTTFAALADPTRRAILARLAAGEASVTELAEPFDMTLPAVSKQPKVLENAGLIARSREAQRRPCRLQAGPLEKVSDWVERYRDFWEQRFDRLDQYLNLLQRKRREHGPQERIDAPRQLGFEAWTRSEHLAHWWAPKGCTTPFCKVDLRPGGVLHYCMRSPWGRDILGGIGVYREIVEPEPIVYTDAFADAEGNPVPPAHYGMTSRHPPETLVTVTCAEHEGKTKLTLRHSILKSVEEREGTQRRWTEMLDRLAEDLAKV